jgi:hypothetical protein
VSLNTVYLIQIGGAAELVTKWGWHPDEVMFVVGGYDALCEVAGRPVLAMEAKARIEGPDSLSALFRSFVRFSQLDEPPEPIDNHSRKYVELLRLAESGGVTLLLVAAGARWTLKAVREESRIRFEAVDTPRRPDDSPTPAVRVGTDPVLRAELDHAVAVATLTERDGAQRVYEFPWRTEGEVQDFRSAVASQCLAAGLRHARPWVWRLSSGGRPLTRCGRDTGIELRFSYYARAS